MAAIGFGCYLNGIAFAALPYRDASHLFEIKSNHPARLPGPTRAQNVAAVRRQTRTLSRMGVYQVTGFDALIDGAPEEIFGAHVDAEVLSILGIQPVAGRSVTVNDTRPASPPVVVVADSLAVNHWGAVSAAIGRSIRLGDAVYAIVGVMPARFDYPSQCAIWIPWKEPPGDDQYVSAMGRLAPSASQRDLSVELESIARGLRRVDPRANQALFLSAEPLGRLARRGNSWLAGRGMQIALYGGILLLAALNVVGLFSARVVARSDEFALRRALGAGRLRIAAVVLLDAFWITAAASVFALVVVWAGLGAMRRAYAGWGMKFNPVIDWRVILLALVLALAVVGIVGIVPAVRAGDARLYQRIGGGARAPRKGAYSILDVVTVLQIAATAGVMLIASQYLELSHRLNNTDVGFNYNNLVTARVSTASRASDSTQTADLDLRQTYLRAVEGVGGVTSVAISTVAQVHVDSSVVFPSEGVAYRDVSMAGASYIGYVSPQYFATLQLPLWRGRLLTADDDASARAVAVVNRRAALLLGGKSVLGETIVVRIGEGDPVPLTIVGVVNDARFNLLFENVATPAVYTSSRSLGAAATTVVARVRSDPSRLAPAIGRAIQSVIPNEAISIAPMSEQYSQQISYLDRYRTPLLATAMLGLFMASIGVFTGLSLGLSRRRHELLIRVALGARRSHVVWMTAGRSILQTSAGYAIGVIVGAVTGRVLASNVAGLHNPTLLGYAVCAAVVLLAGALASARLLWGVVKTDPAAVLRGAA